MLISAYTLLDSSANEVNEIADHRRSAHSTSEALAAAASTIQVPALATVYPPINASPPGSTPIKDVLTDGSDCHSLLLSDDYTEFTGEDDEDRSIDTAASSDAGRPTKSKRAGSSTP